MESTAVAHKRPLAPASVVLAGAMLVAGTIVFLWYAPFSYEIYLAPPCSC